MKKYICILVFFLCFISGLGSRKAAAYTVTVQKDGIYAEAIPDVFVNNTGVIFDKYVKKSMKYYNKYKNADTYTYVSSVPDEYRDFIPVATQIQDSDEIVIRNPFYLYYVGDGSEPDIQPTVYYLFAEKNGELLCMFGIDIDPATGKLSFRYDKMEDSHFKYDEEVMEDGHFVYNEKTVGETLFYMVDDIMYAETPDKISVVWNKKLPDRAENHMILVGGSAETIDWQTMNNEFTKKSYEEKRDEIFGYLTKTKKSKLVTKVEKKLKQELKSEYIEPKQDIGEKGGTGNFINIGVYVLLGIGILIIVVIIGEIIIKHKSNL